MSRELMQQALDALKYHTEHTYPCHQTNVAIELLKKELAKPEQASNEPPDYVEPPTSDYHNGWEEGFKAGMLAKPEQEPYFCKDCGKGLLGEGHIHTCSPQVKRQWVGLTSEELAQLTIDNIGYPTRLTAAIEAKLKEKNSKNTT